MQRVVLFIESGYGYGGSAISLVNIIKHYLDSDMGALVLLNNPRADTGLFDRHKIDVHRISLKRNLNRKGRGSVCNYIQEVYDTLFYTLPYAFFLKRLIKTSRISWVHLNNDISSNREGVLGARLARVPCICHMRPIRQLTRLERWLAKWIAGFIVLSHKSRDFYTRQYPGLQRRLNVVYNPFTDTVRGRSGVHRKPGVEPYRLGGPGLKLGICSNLVPGKGHPVLLDGLAGLVSDARPFRLVIAGAPAPDDLEYQHQLIRQTRRLGLEERVVFAGWVADIRGLMSCLDVVIDCSCLPEGFRRTILEGMFLGKPVIATDTGSAAEVVINGATGFLVQPGNREELTRAIEWCHNNRSQLKAMGQRAYSMVKEKLSMANNRKALKELYSRL